MTELWRQRLKDLNLTAGKMAAVAAAMSLLSALAFYYFIHVPLLAAAQDIHGQAQDMARQITRIGNFCNAHINDKDYLQELKKRQSLADKALPAEMQQGQFWAETERLAERCGIRLLGLTPERNEDGKGCSSMTVKVHISGRYFSLLAFLQGLRDGERLVTVKNMALQEKNVTIDGTLWLNIYAVSDR